MFPQLRKPPHNQQLLSRRSRIHFFMLEYPRIAMRHKYRMQSRSQRRIDVRPGTVPDHPCGIPREFMFFDESMISLRILLRHDLRGRKISLQSGPLDLSRLLRDRTLRHQNQPMPLRKVFQSLRDVGQKFDRMIIDRMGEPGDLGVQLGSDRPRVEPLKCRHQGM